MFGGSDRSRSARGMEEDCGMTEYIGDRKVSVPCVLKELYSDFVVQEILGDKSVLRIASPSEMEKFTKEEQEKVGDETVPAPSFLSAEHLSSLDGMNKDSKPLLVPSQDLSKDDRKALHDFVRLRYGGRLNSETQENAIEITYCGVGSRNRKRKRWHKDVPDQCHFTLAKENKDTSYALGILAKFLNVTVNTFRTHGIKDRRAVTCQRVSCNRIEKERILSLNSRLRGIVVYDFNYDNDELKMGGHWGNRFSIVLRSVPPEQESLLQTRLEELSSSGFINYFGTQRFGSCGTSTAAVGKLILRRDWEAAVRLILNNDHLPGYLGTVGDAVRCWLETGNASQALRFLKGGQAYASIEAIIFKCLARGGTWQKCITEALPINLRSLYVHAYQSLLWNKIVSRRIEEAGTAPRHDDVGHDGATLPDGASPFDIHIPLPGKTSGAENYVSQWYNEMLSADGLTNSSFTSLEDRFALGETSRPMMIHPEDVKWKFIRYSDPRAYLQDGISTRAIDESEMVGDLMALQVQFSLPSGCYATVALRQITGTDMGKHSMKIHSEAARNGCSQSNADVPDAVEDSAMKLSVKNKVDGSLIHIEIDQNETVGDLRSKISSQLGPSYQPNNIRLLLGAEELNLSDSVLIKKSGLVSGDRLFLEAEQPSSAKNAVSDTAPDAKPKTSAENEDNKMESKNSTEKEDEKVESKDSTEREDAKMETDDGPDPITAFRDRIVRSARDYMEDSGYSNSFLQSWSTSTMAGAEVRFELSTRKRTSNILIIITALSRPSLSAVVNVGRIVDMSHNLLSSFTVQPASVKDNVINGVAKALSTSGANGTTLVHLFSLRCIRDQILTHMEPRTLVRLSGTSRLLRSILHAPSVDRTFWSRVLSRDFGQDKVQEAQQSGKSFRSKYQEEYARHKVDHRGSPLLDRGFAPLPYLPPAPHYPPAPQPQPTYPRPPNPDGPWFPAPDPLQPIPDPMNPLAVPPRHNPFGPGAPFGGQGGPLGPLGGRDPLNPFDPNNREIFPSRPNQGQPRGGPRHFPANRWDRNDFI
ncbi:hypothetical protein Q1695_006528 [Nippostrongylus brasiliensis]|nr:hypothetical protein Q1695_006528 [Nippostrongylus brasiliensis]